MTVKNVTQGTVLAGRAFEAKSLWEKAGGLLIRPPLAPGEALVIPSLAPWVHSFFMKYTIDILFLNRAGKVLGARTLAPWRMSRMYLTATKVIELCEGTVAWSRTQLGDAIEINHAP